MPPSPPDNTSRRYDIDALRVLAFALLVLYHAGMFYVADWHWHIKSAYTAQWLKWVMWVANPWRMSLLFLISGLAASFLLRHRDGPGFARDRLKRLLLPLLFGMAVVVPPQAYLQALSNGSFAGNYAQFLLHYFTFRPWAPDAFDGSHIGITWNHLWYLPYLLGYSLLLAILAPLLHSRAGRSFRDGFRALRGIRLWLLPALPLAAASWLLAARFPATYALIDDWHSHAIYLPMFLFGYWMGTDPGLWAELRRLRWWLLGAAIATYLLAFPALPALLDRGNPLPDATFALVRRLNAWTWILLVLAWGHHLLNRPFAWLPYASQAIFPWYVLHQTFTVLAGYHLARLSLGPVLEPVLVIAFTVAGCVLTTEFLIRRTPWLRPLFGMKAIPVGSTPPAPWRRERPCRE